LDQKVFITLLTSAAQHGVSDIHVRAGETPAFRIKGDLVGVKCPPFTDADLQDMCRYMIADARVHDRLADLKEHDGSFEVKDLGRFRYNIFRHQGKLGAVLRLIPSQVPTIEKLGLPPVLRKIAQFSRGLVLVTGVTGSGKSSTLAAMIDAINQTSPVHVLTIEDPIEFLHANRKARLTQREVGRDTGDFADALRAALRQDPDVILVGEMRDAQTIDVALKAAETGHLVFSTVHTTDAVKTIGRLVSVFPSDEQRMARLRLADNLVATISQRLVKRADGRGVVAAQEIMIANAGIQECIADPARTGEINDYIQKSRELSGGQTFDQHLAELYQAGVITLNAAKEASSNASDFERNLMYGATAKGAETRHRMDEAGAIQLEDAVIETTRSRAADENSLDAVGFSTGQTQLGRDQERAAAEKSATKSVFGKKKAG
jgi:twitching motility protein PilT